MISKESVLKVGTKAPDFSLLDQNGENHSLSDYLGKWVFVYFYPKDDTPGCTAEACSVRDNYSILKDMGVAVFGVSADSVKSHKKFEEKFKLNFSLLADTDKKTVEDYGVWSEKKFMGKSYMGIARTSFLINPKGEIAKVYENVKPEIHLSEVISDLKTLQS